MACGFTITLRGFCALNCTRKLLLGSHEVNAQKIFAGLQSWNQAMQPEVMNSEDIRVHSLTWCQAGNPDFLQERPVTDWERHHDKPQVELRLISMLILRSMRMTWSGTSVW